MSAYESARLDDYRQRAAKGESLSEREQRDLNALEKQSRTEWENAERPRWLGGDYPDVF